GSTSRCCIPCYATRTSSGAATCPPTASPPRRPPRSGPPSRPEPPPAPAPPEAHPTAPWDPLPRPEPSAPPDRPALVPPARRPDQDPGRGTSPLTLENLGPIGRSRPAHRYRPATGDRSVMRPRSREGAEAAGGGPGAER